MKITSVTEYYSALERLMVFEEAMEGYYCALLSDADLAEEDELYTATTEYLKGLSPMGANSVGAKAPSPELREKHELRKGCADNDEYGYLRHLAYTLGIKNISRDIENLRRQTVSRLQQDKLLHDRHIQDVKQRKKEHGRIVECQMCSSGFYSDDTERIKPYGSSRYQRFCKPCAAKVKEAKAIYQCMTQKRRNKT
jgi:hypothetical protein